jgi:hypothetical protein
MSNTFVEFASILKTHVNCFTSKVGGHLQMYPLAMLQQDGSE